MDTPHNRGSPRLQFTKEELEDGALSGPIAKAEETADRYDAARKKLKKRYRMKLSREEAETPQPAKTEAETDSLEPTGSIAEAGSDIRTDPKAPAVRNTRQKPNTASGSSGKKAGSKESAVRHTESADTTSSVSSAPSKKKAVRLKFEETQAKKPSRL